MIRRDTCLVCGQPIETRYGRWVHTHWVSSVDPWPADHDAIPMRASVR